MGKALLAASLGALISIAGGFVQVPPCGRAAGTAGKCWTGEASQPRSLGLNPHSFHTEGSHAALRRRTKLLAAPEDFADDQLQRGVVTPAGVEDLQPSVATIPPVADLDPGAVAPKKGWKIFSREHDTEIASMAIPSYTAVLLDPIGTAPPIPALSAELDSSEHRGGLNRSTLRINLAAAAAALHVNTFSSTDPP